MTEVQEQTTETSQAEVDDLKPGEGRKPVEFENPETEARFKRVYASMKQNERISVKMAADLRTAHERLEKMEQERERQSTDKRAAELRAEEKTALEEGDYEKATAARDQITDLKVDAKVPKPKEKEPEPWLTEEKETQIAEWAGQRDEKGNLLRPWADPEHENHETMVEIAEGIVRKNPDITLDALLGRWDAKIKSLTPRPTRNAAPVLDGSQDIRPSSKKTLSEDEKLIVKRMYPKLSDKEAQERYLKSKELNT